MPLKLSILIILRYSYKNLEITIYKWQKEKVIK